jgi:hypothetical protein
MVPCLPAHVLQVGDSAASSCGGAASSAGAPSNKASGGGVEGEASIPESLLAAKTLQEVEAIVARVFSSDGGSSAASGSTYNASSGGSNMGGNGVVSRLSGTGTRDSMPGAEDVAAEAHLAAELERYKQQVQELQEAKDALQAEALLANAKAEEVAALQAANEQLVLQVTMLNQAAEQASSSQQQQQELQQQLEALKPANADLQVQLEQLQQERERLQQQNARLRWLEEELVDLQLQIADLLQQNKDLAAELAAAKLQQLAKPVMHSDVSMQSAATSDSAAAVSAVRAATQSLTQVSYCCYFCILLLYEVPSPSIPIAWSIFSALHLPHVKHDTANKFSHKHEPPRLTELLPLLPPCSWRLAQSS